MNKRATAPNGTFMQSVLMRSVDSDCTACRINEVRYLHRTVSKNRKLNTHSIKKQHIKTLFLKPIKSQSYKSCKY